MLITSQAYERLILKNGAVALTFQNVSLFNVTFQVPYFNKYSFECLTLVSVVLLKI